VVTNDRVRGGTALSAVIGWLSSLPAPGLMGAAMVLVGVIGVGDYVTVPISPSPWCT
jgi:hypothetical protein